MKREKRQKMILKACQSLFAIKGYKKTNVSQLVDFAGVSRGTFYLYFKNKKQVFEALLKDLFKEFEAVINHSPDLFQTTASQKDLAVQLQSFLKDYAPFAAYLLSDHIHLPQAEQKSLQAHLERLQKTFSQKALMHFGHRDFDLELSVFCSGLIQEVLRRSARESSFNQLSILESVLQKMAQSVSVWTTDSHEHTGPNLSAMAS